MLVRSKRALPDLEQPRRATRRSALCRWFGGSFNRIRDAAGIAYTDPETGMARAKHLHDLRGTFATKLIIHPANLTDHEVADIMGWSPQQVAAIRCVYVDQARVIVAIGQRIRGAL